MRREWKLDDLIECWTLDEEDVTLIANKAGVTRLGFALMLKFFEQEARFPRREDVPKVAVEFMAGQVKVDPALFAGYDFTARQAKNHRAQIREFHGFREPTVGDEDKLVLWLAGEMCPVEMARDRFGRRCWPAAARRRSSRPSLRGSSGYWVAQRRCSSGSSLPALWSACQRGRSASWRS
jgi:hypothetical protein